MEHLRRSERKKLFDTKMLDGNFFVKPQENVCDTLDILNCSEIFSFLQGVVTRLAPKNIIFDMSNIESIDSSAFGVLISIDRLLSKSGKGGVTLINLPECVTKALDMLEMKDYFKETPIPDEVPSFFST